MKANEKKGGRGLAEVVVIDVHRQRSCKRAAGVEHCPYPEKW